MYYKDVIAYISDIPKFTKKHTLEATRDFIKRLGNPCHGRKILHVAGTNGKGSVCAYMQAILLSEEKTVGFFTSPHLEKMNERIRINGTQISDEEFVRIFQNVKTVVDQMMKEGEEHPSYFEFLYGMGLLAFEDAGVEYVILETGLGGRLDATNSFETPLLSVITSIGMDHTGILGNTISEIAGEKAGIIKRGVPVIFDGSQEEASVVIRKTAQEMEAPCREIGKDAFEIKEISEKHIAFSILDDYDNNTLWQVKGTGIYQMMNASLAIAGMIYIFGGDCHYEKWQKAIREVCWSGRMEEILPNVILDGAHNPPAIRKFIESVGLQKKRNIVILFSVVTDKDYKRMIQELCEGVSAKSYVITKLEDERGASCQEIAETFAAHTRAKVVVKEELQDAFAEAMKEKGEDGVLYCLGSLYLIGELKTLIGGNYA